MASKEGTTSVGDVKTMRAVQFKQGGPENMYIGSVPLPTLREKEILVKVYATGINRADTIQRRGLYPAPPGESETLGLEAAGVVESVKDGVTKWKEGDSVMCLLSGGGNAEYVALHQDLAMSVPSGFSFLQAAAIPETWLTAFQLLHFVGHIQNGDVVLIHAAGSGVGIAAIQIAKKAGATVIATAGTDDKLQSARDLGASHVFNYKRGDFYTGVLEATNNRGVDVILDCIGESFWEQNLNSLAMDGRWVLYGLLGGGACNGALFAKLLRKRGHLLATTLRSRTLAYRSELIGAFKEKCLPYFENGDFKIVISNIFPFGKISEAHALMENNSNTGKIVIQVRPEESLTEVK